MLFLFLIHSLLTRAAPLPVAEYSIISSSCKDTYNCRTLLGIIWSCITTVFLCTWAVHPNIPEPKATNGAKPLERSAPAARESALAKVKKFWSLFGDRILLFICALLVPEYILTWAMRQYTMAGKIAKANCTLSQLIVHAVA
jgi:hypothetical protein